MTATPTIMRITRSLPFKVAFVGVVLLISTIIVSHTLMDIFSSSSYNKRSHLNVQKTSSQVASWKIASGKRLDGGNSSRGVSGSPGSRALLRVLVLTFNRANSLRRCLESLNSAEYDGLPVQVDIHVDLDKQKKVHAATLAVARNFTFQHGKKEVHVRPRHVGVIGQWLQTWHVPKDDTSEIAVFVEDDITVSAFFARWLRRVHDKYDGYTGINGYALQGETNLHGKGHSGKLRGPPGQSVFVYPVLGSWGFSPNTASWRNFMSWYHEKSQKPGFIPQVPGLMPSVWYLNLYKGGKADTMWTMWHIYHAYQNHLYTLYPNLPESRGLTFNWKEPGEHYDKRVVGKGIHAHLLETWREEDVRLPENLMVVDVTGTVMGHRLTPNGVQKNDS